MKLCPWLAALLAWVSSEPIICTTPAKSQPVLRALIQNANASLISDRMKDFIITWLLDATWDATLVGESIAQNALNQSFSLVQSRDAEWKMYRSNASLGFNADQMYMLNSTAALRLQSLTTEFGDSVGEAFLMDAQGVLVGTTNLTSDLWQGDEEKWINSFNNCEAGVDIGVKSLDLSSLLSLQHISLPIISKQNVVVGAVTWGLREASLPCTFGPSVATLTEQVKATSMPDNLKNFVLTKLLPLSWDPMLVEAARAVNALQMPLETLLRREDEWQAAVNSSLNDPSRELSPLQNDTVASPLAQYLRYRASTFVHDRAVTAVTLMGIQGEVVAASVRTANYYYGEKAQHIDSFNDCIGGVHVGEFEKHEGYWARTISLPVLDSATVGAITWEVGAAYVPSDTQLTSLFDIEDLVTARADLSDRSKQFILDVLLPYMQDRVLVNAAEESNSRGIPAAASKLENVEWSAGYTNNTYTPKILGVLNCNESKHIRHLRTDEIGEGAVVDIFVMDFDGKTIAMTQPTQEYWQGDEAIHSNTVNGGVGNIDVRPVTKDDFGQAVQQVSIPLLATRNRVVGVLAADIVEDGLPCTQPAIRLSHMRRKVNNLTVPEEFKRWIDDMLLPQIIDDIYVNDTLETPQSSLSVAELARREASWSSNTTLQGMLQNTPSARKLQEFQIRFPPVTHAFVTGIRGEVVGSLGVTQHFWFQNTSVFQRAFDNCEGNVNLDSSVQTGSDFGFVLSFPVIGVDNHVQGVISFTVEYPPIVHKQLAVGFDAHLFGFSVFTLVYALALMAIFFVNRKTVLIKMASPVFLFMSLCGAICTSFGIFDLVQQPTTDANTVCLARTLILPLGFNLFFSPLFVKSYRIYKIFEATLGKEKKQFHRTKFRNKYVFIRVATSFVIQLLICILGLVLPDYPRTSEIKHFDFSSLQRTHTWYCSQSTAFLALTLLYEVGMVMFGAVISVLGRRYPSAFNESVYIMISLNILAFYSILIIPAQYFIPDFTQLAYLNIVGGHVVLWTAMSLVFGTKVVKILRGKANEKVVLVLAPTAERESTSSGKEKPSTTATTSSPSPDKTRTHTTVSSMSKPTVLLELPKVSGNSASREPESVAEKKMTLEPPPVVGETDPSNERKTPVESPRNETDPIIKKTPLSSAEKPTKRLSVDLSSQNFPRLLEPSPQSSPSNV